MTLVDKITTLRVLGLRAAALAAPFAPLLARLVFGQAFAQTGYGKLTNFAATTSFFQELGIPAPAANAAIVGTVELLGGICLLLVRAFIHPIGRENCGSVEHDARLECE